MKIFAIDPGPELSAYVVWDGRQLLQCAKVTNDELYWKLTDACERDKSEYFFVCEQIQSYGMPVGKDVFDTVFFSGRLYDICYRHQTLLTMLPRKDVKRHLCGVVNAKDSNIIAALKERFGEKPTKKRPNPTYNGFKPARDEWQAWALAVYAYDIFIEQPK